MVKGRRLKLKSKIWVRILNLPNNPGEDAADALGIALCAGYSKDGRGAEARFRLSSRSRSGIMAVKGGPEMIGRITGTLLGIEQQTALLDVGGIGCRSNAPSVLSTNYLRW